MNKNIFRLSLLFTFLCIYVNFSPDTIFAADPILDIKANNSDGPITIETVDTLSIAISCDPGSYTGTSADWYIVVNTSSGWQSFNISQMDYSTSGLLPLLQNYGLFSLGSTQIYSTSSLSAGTYTYYFGVILSGQLYYDSVTVTVGTVQSTSGTVSLPRTGQTTCSDEDRNVIDCTGTGQDGDTLTGVEWPDPRFTDKGDSTVTDNLTGLVWTQDANLPSKKTTWQEALDYVAGMNEGTYSNFGHTDWRLPNINELESLVNAKEDSSTTWLTSQGFTNLQSTYWSSTSYTKSTGNARCVYMNNGVVHYGNKTTDIFISYYVWPVRSGSSEGTIDLPQTGQTTCYDEDGGEIDCTDTGQDGDIQAGVAWPSPRFTDNGDSTVTDNLTELVWAQDADHGVGKTWQEALDYVAGLNSSAYLGYTDWLLPNRKELLSLIDYSQSSPPISTGHPFTNVQSGGYISSTSRASSAAYAYGVFMVDGILSYYQKTNGNWVWPVRAGQ